jgi:hypothetical protein
VDIKKLNELAPELLNSMKEYLKAIGIKAILEMKTDGFNDPTVEFDNGIGVMIMYVNEPTIAGSKYAIRFGAYKFVSVPGVRYRRDGSGEPDDVDVIDIGSPTNMEEAVVLAITEYVGQKLNDFHNSKHRVE